VLIYVDSHASTAVDPHENMQLDKMTNSQTGRRLECELARQWLFKLFWTTILAYETPGAAPRHHLFHQRSSTTGTLSTTMPCRPPPCCSMITRHIAHDGVLAISTRLLHRPIVIRHEALVGSPPRGKHSFRSSTLL
jgi:hypothetical protein